MGRYVYELSTGECAWKYWFGEQDSNQSEIVISLGIGEVQGMKSVPTEEGTVRAIIDPENVANFDDPEDLEDLECDFDDPDCNSDVVTLTRDDIKKLTRWLTKHKDDPKKSESFYQMIEAYRDLMLKHTEIEIFRFQGEY